MSYGSWKQSKTPCIPSSTKEDHWTVWVTGLGSFSRENASKQNPSFQMQSGAGLIGTSKQYEGIRWEGTVGGVLGYGTSLFQEDNQSGKGQVQGPYASLYGDAVWKSVYVEGSVLAGYQRMKHARHIAYSSIDVVAEGAHNGWQLDPHVGLGWYVWRQGIRLALVGNVDYAWMFEQKWTEQGADTLNMKYPSRTASLLRTEGGIREEWVLEREENRLLVLLQESVVYKKWLHTGPIHAFLIGSPTFVSLDSLHSSEWIGVLNAEILYERAEGFFVSMRYTGELGSGYLNQQGTFRFGVSF